ncbi:MAG TPA: hypothetical protein VNL37_08360, partial [Candidatus Polarisedimenticolia bacterium]|nr:hypothetical protein [Candidatus Polarisedimenticolia bacterium]
RTPAGARLRLRVLRAPYWHLVGPRPPPGEDHPVGDLGSMRVEAGGIVRVEITRRPASGRSAYVWNEGRLEMLFPPGSS